jgi:cytoskeletal protein CcmA (bactofilin family)
MHSRYSLITLLALTGFFLLGMAGTAHAAETASSELVIIREGDTSPGDLYAAGVRVIVEGTVEGDLIAFAAEEVQISGEVTGNVIAVAPSVRVSGSIGGSLRYTANHLIVSGSVGEDAVGASWSADLDPDSEVGGDVLAWAVGFSSSGGIGGDLSGTQRSTRLRGSVGGNVDITVTTVAIDGPLEVGGDLGYRSSNEATGLTQVTVGGVVVHKEPLPPNIRVRALGILARILVVLGLTVTALLVAWGWPERTSAAGENVLHQPVKAFGYGALVMLSPLVVAAVAALALGVAPAAASLPLLAIFVPLVLAFSGIVLVLSLLAGVPASMALGRVIRSRLGLYGSIVLGSAVLGVVWLLPWVSILAPLLALPVGMGGWLLGQSTPST